MQNNSILLNLFQLACDMETLLLFHFHTLFLWLFFYYLYLFTWTHFDAILKLFHAMDQIYSCNVSCCPAYRSSMCLFCYIIITHIRLSCEDFMMHYCSIDSGAHSIFYCSSISTSLDTMGNIILLLRFFHWCGSSIVAYW